MITLLLSLTLLFSAAEPVEIGEPLAIVCHEDQPCWDCRTMGNHICGSFDSEGNRTLTLWTNPRHSLTAE